MSLTPPHATHPSPLSPPRTHRLISRAADRLGDSCSGFGGEPNQRQIRRVIKETQAKKHTEHEQKVGGLAVCTATARGKRSHPHPRCPFLLLRASPPGSEFGKEANTHIHKYVRVGNVFGQITHGIGVGQERVRWCGMEAGGWGRMQLQTTSQQHPTRHTYLFGWQLLLEISPFPGGECREWYLSIEVGSKSCRMCAGGVIGSCRTTTNYRNRHRTRSLAGAAYVANKEGG